MSRYVDHPSDAGLEQPGRLDGVTFYGFELPARTESLRARLTQTFAGTGIEARPATDRAFLVFAAVDCLRSARVERGMLSYNDVALWILVELRDVASGQRLGGPFTMWPAYIFVDHPHPMVTGRETFGLAKQMGEFGMPDGPGFAHELTVDVWGTEARGSDVPIERRRLWTLQRTGSRASLAGDLLGPLTRLLGPLAAALPSVTVVGLRQLRDPADPRVASYRSVVTAPIELRRIHDGGLLPGAYALRVHALASHPVLQDLGLSGPTVPVLQAGWFRADLDMQHGTEVWTAPTPRHSVTTRRRRRVAVLGGGIAALTAAWELTEPGVDAEVTVYTRGWRLGGKGASGRNLRANARIEEHGLHMWYGFYENAFALMQRCYGELDRPADHPVPTWERAFEPQNYVVLNEQHEGRWVRWRLNFPNNDRVPGQGGIPTDLWLLARTTLGLLGQVLGQVLDDTMLPARVRSRLGRARVLRTGRGPIVAGAAGALARALALVERRWSSRRDRGRSARDLSSSRRLVRWMVAHRAWLRSFVFAGDHLQHDGLRMYWMLVDTATSIFKGLVEEQRVVDGLDELDDLDLRDWLRRHGASELTCTQAPCVRFIYNAGFSFVDGDPERPDFAAGCALRGLLRLLLTYKGAVLYKMRGGMGDIVFAPLYEALVRRGVRFELFQSVEHLALDDEDQRIERIDLVQQAKAPGYRPLVEIDGMLCWPSEPDYGQIERGGHLRQRLVEQGLDLERCSAPAGWSTEPHSLRRGRDFDDVVLAIPVGAQAALCHELMEARPAWRAMVTGVPTVGTQAYQLWMTRDLMGLGWTEPSPILGTFIDPVDTWSDMSFLLPLEDHGPQVRSLAYFCGVIPTVWGETAPEAAERVVALGRKYYEQACPSLWPATSEGGRTRWDLLADPEQREGAGRLAAQYFRANIEGSERYVQSLSGTIGVRLRAGASGFDNLFLAGDWTDNGLNCGCIEAAVISGRQAARALAGISMTIPGETDRWLAELFGVRSSADNRHDAPPVPADAYPRSLARRPVLAKNSLYLPGKKSTPPSPLSSRTHVATSSTM